MSLNARDKSVAEEFKTLLEQRVPFVSLKLFGSRAPGDGNPESDFGFLVVVSEVNDDIRRAIRRAAWEVAFKHNTILQTTILTHDQLTSGPEATSTLVQVVDEEGVAI